MEDKFLDLFFVHLSQQNFESCHQFLDQSSNSEAIPALRHLITFEVFYISFDWLRYDDANRQAILHSLHTRMQSVTGSSDLLRGVLRVVDVRIHLAQVYLRLVKRGEKGDVSEELEGLVQTLKKVAVSALSTYKEACLYEVQCLSTALHAGNALLALDYYTVILTLTVFREHLRHWELLFIHKKYTPTHKNSKIEYNQVYRWHVQHLHNILATASILFYPELHGMVDGELAEYGLELKERCGVDRVEVMCVRLGVELCCVVGREENGVNHRYSFPVKRNEEIGDLLSGHLVTASSSSVTKVSLTQNYLLLSPLSESLFLCFMFPKVLDSSRPLSFLQSLTQRLRCSLPFTS